MITQGIFCYNLPPVWPFRKSDPAAGVILWDHMLLIVGLYIDHGREDNADYQYLVLPASTAEKTAAFAVQDIRVIRNDTSIQAVAVGNCFYVTAYESQVVNLQKDLQVDLQTPGIYMFRLHNGNWLIEAADPTHKQHSLSLKMNRKDVKIVFPPCHEPGKSISAG